MSDREKLRDKLLEAALAHVPFDGWTEKALIRGAENIGRGRGDVLRLFPGGGTEALEAFLRRADVRMLEALDHHDLEALRVHERVRLAIRLRFEGNVRYREAIRRGLATLALPQNAGLGLKSLYRTVDSIWAAAGDRSTDYNWYTKRLLLAGVYSSVLLFWLEDESDDYQESWAFLDRRLADVAQVPKGIAKVRKALDRLPDPSRLFRPPASR